MGQKKKIKGERERSSLMLPRDQISFKNEADKDIRKDERERENKKVKKWIA